MKAEELRLGCWFIGYDDKPFQWDLEHFALLGRECEGLADIDEIIKNPIPLTEEILLKCGFEKVSTMLDLPIYEIGVMPTFIIEKFTEISDYFTLRYCDVITRKLGESYRICDVKYLHQLQNLIYCLTGKELEVKL